jgi:hypothetical protein
LTERSGQRKIIASCAGKSKNKRRGGGFMRLRGITQISLVVALSATLGACAGPVIAGMSLSTFSTIVDGVVSVLSGKSLEEHALSYITGKDCNLTESILHKDRKLCEEPDSLATRDDFRGILTNFGDQNSDLLDRYARARQQELAEAGDAKPFAVAYDGVPVRGAKPGYAKIGNMVVYLMAPIYEPADLTAPLHRRHVPVVKPPPQQPGGAEIAAVSLAPAN